MEKDIKLVMDDFIKRYGKKGQQNKENSFDKEEELEKEYQKHLEKYFHIAVARYLARTIGRNCNAKSLVDNLVEYANELKKNKNRINDTAQLLNMINIIRRTYNIK